VVLALPSGSIYENAQTWKGIRVVDVILNEDLIAQGEPCFIIYVDRPRGAGQAIVAELAMDVVGRVSAEMAKPRKLSGFELPALEMVHLAQKRAADRGVQKILLVDPQGLLPLAKLNRYARPLL
jgi:hypothetical protein